MNYKILCSDLDGTLLSTKNDVSDFAVSEFSRIKNTLKIILVSARMPRAMTYLQRRLGIENEPIICYNGALVMDGTTEVSSTVLDIDAVVALTETAAEHMIKVGLYHKDEWYADEHTEVIRKEIYYTQTTPVFRDTRETLADLRQRKLGVHKIMLMAPGGTLDFLSKKLPESFAEHMQFYRSTDLILEAIPGSVSKLSAIQSLLKEDQSLKRVIAFGDNYNDMEMLQAVGCGVAVGNARDEVKAVADKITSDNTDDGVAHFIKRYL
ncbi:MAG TPA: Cof-type HAD-IIB family hydrolase [Eudoraea sp.]|nr:Cof-type HAD-IIB family hydrolase [Eudoraea sp.]